MTEHDGSFRRLMETVRQKQATPITGRPGRPPKHRVSATGPMGVGIHNRMKHIAQVRTNHAERLVSLSDVCTEACVEMVTDLHALLGDELRLPGGATSLTGVLGLRELIDRPILTPLNRLELHGTIFTRTTVYIDLEVWEALVEMSLRFGLSMRKTVYPQHLIDLAAAWYLAGIESQGF